MDWRSRKYYLVQIPWFSRDMRLSYFKLAAPSLKLSSPYNHKKCIVEYDGELARETGVYRPDCMMSCKIEESEALEYELRKMVRNDDGHGAFYELKKNFCGQ